MNEDENTGSTLSNLLDKLPPDKAVATAKAMMITATGTMMMAVMILRNTSAS